MKYSLPSDLWSAGVMAYQLVTGRLPFSGEEGEEVSTLYMQTQRFEHKVRRPLVPNSLHAAADRVDHAYASHANASQVSTSHADSLHDAAEFCYLIDSTNF